MFIPIKEEMEQVWQAVLNQTDVEGVEREIRTAREAGHDFYAEYDKIGYTPFIYVCVFNFSETVLQGFLNAANIDDMLRLSRDKFESSVLNLAVNPNNINKERNVRMILERCHSLGASLVNLPNKEGGTPIMIAACLGFARILQLLLAAGANVWAVAPLHGQTPFHICCGGGHTNCARLLLDHDINLLDAHANKNATALFFASSFGHLLVVQLLIGLGASLAANAYGRTPFDTAIDYQHFAVAEMLAKYYANQVVQREGRLAMHSVLHGATFSYDTQAAAQQPSLRVQLQLGNSTCVFRWIFHLLSETVRDYDYSGSLPIHAALHAGAPVEVLEVLVAAYAAGLTIPNAACLLIPNNDGDLAMHTACSEAAPPETVRWLLEQYDLYADSFPPGDRPPPVLQTRNLRGETPLHCACRADAPLETIRLLLDRFPDARSIPDSDGYLPLHLHLASTSDSEVVKFWTAKNPKAMTIRTRAGRLPFHVVALENPAAVGVIFEVLNGHPVALSLRNN